MKILTALLLLLASANTSAAMITLDISGADDALTTPLTLSAILDVDEGSGEMVAFSSFNLNVLFDNTLFDYVTDSASSSLPMGVIAAQNPAGVGVTYFNLGDVMVSADTTLFSLQLQALSAGTTSLSLMLSELYSGGFMTPAMPVVLAQNTASQQVTVAQSVPVPHTLGLFVLALGLMLRRFRR
ncbi:hypothetical protein [Alteromonas halophila]|uniref:PEP-CTERM sorting domain-containing protein n=1 Tax=Alteromonas halophila TaxID=516698 RepID=A0A918MXX1_9ALTE|nr:hypothetical protein [Alteromonas halophila]GGW80354.1 hypothetical protein GCM10007391_11580 [Alteromonas halophila]